MRRLLAVVLCGLSLGGVRADGTELEKEEADGTELVAALLDIDASRVLSYLASFEGQAARIIADPTINRWTEKGGKPEGLGEQEVRGLMQKAGVGGDGPRAFFIRGQLAPTAIRLLDGSGDGKLDAAELQAALDTVPCFLPGWQLQLESLEAAGAALLQGATAASLDRLLAGARACPGTPQLWAVWAGRAGALERSMLPALGKPAAACEEGLVELLLPGGRSRQRAGLRSGLQRVLGDGAPLALRHGLAVGLLAAADGDADGRLSAEEVRSVLAAPACAAAHELRQVDESAVEGAAAVLLAHHATFAQTAAAAAADEAVLLGRPLESLDVAEGIKVGLAFVRHAARDARRKGEL